MPDIGEEGFTQDQIQNMGPGMYIPPTGNYGDLKSKTPVISNDEFKTDKNLIKSLQSAMFLLMYLKQHKLNEERLKILFKNIYPGTNVRHPNAVQQIVSKLVEVVKDKKEASRALEYAIDQTNKFVMLSPTKVDTVVNSYMMKFHPDNVSSPPTSDDQSTHSYSPNNPLHTPSYFDLDSPTDRKEYDRSRTNSITLNPPVGMGVGTPLDTPLGTPPGTLQAPKLKWLFFAKLGLILVILATCACILWLAFQNNTCTQMDNNVVSGRVYNTLKQKFKND